jgi:hypothetical protein
VSDSERVTMSVLGACWCRPILGRIKEVLKESKKHRKIGESARNRGNKAPKIEENTHREKSVTKWENCCGAVGKWTSVDLENNWIEDQP